jgi:hypothetical protein
MPNLPKEIGPDASPVVSGKKDGCRPQTESLPVNPSRQERNVVGTAFFRTG